MGYKVLIDFKAPNELVYYDMIGKYKITMKGEKELDIKITDKNKKVLFSASGKNLDCVYEGEYQERDKIIIHKKDMEFVKIQL